MTQTTPLGVRIDQRVKDKLDAVARSQFRSTASLVTQILSEWLADNGGDVVPIDAPEPQFKPHKAPGRPFSRATFGILKRQGRTARYANGDEHFLASMLIPWIGERKRIAAAETLEKWPNFNHDGNLEITLRRFFHELGWSEYSDGSINGFSQIVFVDQ